MSWGKPQNGPLDTRRSVMVAVEMKDGKIIRQFNRDALNAAAAMKARMPEGMEIRVLSDQPNGGGAPNSSLRPVFPGGGADCDCGGFVPHGLALGIGGRHRDPLTVAMTLVGMYLLNIPLQQISIAALIIALGMLVDVPVVASDGINRALHMGEPRLRAAWIGPYNLRHPMVFGTLINIVAFFAPAAAAGRQRGVYEEPAGGHHPGPGLGAVGFRHVHSADQLLHFARAEGLRRGQRGSLLFPVPLVDLLLAALLPRYRAALEGALKHPWPVLAGAYTLLGLSFLLAPMLGTQFFPPAERNQLLIDVELPSTDSLTSMRAAVDRVVALVKGHNEVLSAAVFTGGRPRAFITMSPPRSRRIISPRSSSTPAARTK